MPHARNRVRHVDRKLAGRGCGGLPETLTHIEQYGVFCVAHSVGQGRSTRIMRNERSQVLVGNPDQTDAIAGSGFIPESGLPPRLGMG
jgi:hypothetical protein